MPTKLLTGVFYAAMFEAAVAGLLVLLYRVAVSQ